MARRSSNPRRTRLANRPGGKRTLAIIGLIAFAIADVALIAMALDLFGGQADAPATTARPVTSFTPEPSPEPTETAEPIEPATPVLRTLAVVDEQTAWRAERGSCDTQAVIELTTDGGATWQRTVPSATESHEVLWLWAQDDDYAQAVVNAGDDCETTGIRTFTGGNEWVARDDVLPDAVYLAVDGSLVTPQGFAAPCDAPVDVAQRGGAVAVLCADGTLHETTDGADWAQATIPGALSVTDAGDGYAVAVRGLESCEGIALVSIGADVLATGGEPSAERSCLTGAVDPAATTVDTSASAVWLWSGDEQGTTEIGRVLP